MTTTIRLALTDADRAAAYRLRYELYVEDQKLFLDAADHERRWLRDEYDDHSAVFLAEVDGRLVGTSRMTCGGEAQFSQESREAYDFERFRGIVDERDLAVVTRLVVRHEFRGGDLGFRLLEAGYAYAARQNCELILGNCEPFLVSHYLKLAFRPFGRLENHPTNGALVRIAVVTGDDDYLERIGSPMLAALRQRTRPSTCLPQILAAMDRDRAVINEQQEGTEHYLAEVGRHLGTEDGGLRGALAGLTRDEARSLLSRSQILTCRAGDVLFSRGHVSRTVYVLLSGSLVVHGGQGTKTHLASAGSLVGETAFFAGGARRRNAAAGPEGARVLALNERTLRRLLAGHLVVAAKFLHTVTRNLSRRLAGPERGAR